MKKDIQFYLERLFHLNRSLTGAGNRKTLQILRDLIDIELIEYGSGQSVYDWVIPDEWNIRSAFIKDCEGTILIDFDWSNLHVVGYSTPVDNLFDKDELLQHLYFIDHMESTIPYRTSYYKRTWGFCVTKVQYETIAASQGPFHVYIDSQFNSEGSLTVGEYLCPGRDEEELLVSTYICHPSLANDNLSGMILTAFLAKAVKNMHRRKKSYRFVWVPETVGAVAYMNKNESKLKKIKSGLVVTTVGGPGRLGYKQSFDSKACVNRIAETVLKQVDKDYITYPFDIHGSDERQYSTHGIGINCVSITKDKYYEYPEYHTSDDNLDFVSGAQIAKTLEVYTKFIDMYDRNVIYKNRIDKGEVMLSKHDLYPEVGGASRPGKDNSLDIRRWLLFHADGTKDLLHISELTGYGFDDLAIQAEILEKKGVLVHVRDERSR